MSADPRNVRAFLTHREALEIESALELVGELSEAYAPLVAEANERINLALVRAGYREAS